MAQAGPKAAPGGLRILYVEDDPRAAADISELAAESGDQVVWEADGAAGLARAGAERFDVIILDRMLPDLDGMAIIRRLRESGVGTPVLMLSALGRTSDRAEGLDAGADDYLAKPFEAAELLARLRALHRRASGREHSAVIIYGAFECHVKARTAFRDNRHLALSPKEFELFRYFMENAGEVVTREMLLRDVWGMSFDPQTNVVDVNIGRLRRKLEEGFARPALETIWGTGYRLLDGAVRKATASEVPFRRSIFARLAMSAILVSLAATLLLWIATAATIERAATAALQRAVDVDLAGLADIYASGGEAELAQRIADRLALADGDGRSPHYLLADRAGRRLAGDIRAWPELSASLSQAGYVELADGTPIFARATLLAPDRRLLVGREHGGDLALRREVGLSFIGVGALVALLVGLFGRAAARRLTGRIAGINRAFRSPDAENLAPLVRAGKAEDEIGELARHSAAAIARQQRLADKHRETSDQIAHELRTPLMHLDTRLVRVLSATSEDPTRAALGEARGDVRQIVVLLESLLDIATSESRRGDRHGLAPVNLSALATRIGELYSDSAEESGHRFELAIAPNVIVAGEEMQLTRLITNLLDNAFKYVPAGCSVRLSVQPGPIVTVADTGPGIRDEDRARIFERFQRGGRDRGGTSDGQGAGLGLALARAIAERHGLKLILAPSDRGARFVVAPQEIAT